MELQELTYTSSKCLRNDTAPQVIGLEQLLAMPGYKSKEYVLDSGRAWSGVSSLVKLGK